MDGLEDTDEFSNTITTVNNVNQVILMAEAVNNFFPPVPRVVFRDQMNPLEAYNDRDIHKQCFFFGFFLILHRGFVCL